MTYEEWKAAWSVSLNPQQEQAIQAVDGPVLLLAVPGSGKTTVLVLRLGYMILCRHIPPERILTMTYTVAATQDMRARFASLFGTELAQRLEFRTINGLSARIIRYYEITKGRTAFRLVNHEGKLSAIIADLYRKSRGEFALEATIKELRTTITYIKNRQLNAEEIACLKRDNLPIGLIYRGYCAVLRQNGWMDYDDQMVYAARILRNYPDILKHFQEEYPYLCVDEAQDTSSIQHSILRMLAGTRRNVFMVGDEDQSIYGFRAADPSELMHFEERYPGGRVLLMETNYRSVSPIVEAADRFIRQNVNRRSKHMVPARGSGPELEELWVQDRAGQYEVLAHIAETCSEETAVLYRNHESGLPLLDLLNRRGIGCRCRQAEGTFFSHRIVRDVADFIHFAQQPANGELFMRIYYKFHAGISKAAAQWAVRTSGGTRPILDQLIPSQDISQRTRIQCEGLIRHFAQLSQERGDQAVYQIRHFLGYGTYLKERGTDLGKLTILEVLGRQEPSPERLLDRLDELKNLVHQGSFDPDSPLILSTIHASKGLEYDRVILMDVADGILPSVEQKSSEQKVDEAEEEAAYEEERRLFYVGMTRAKNKLMLFRFRQGDLSSTFAEALFPRPEPKTQPKKSFRLPVWPSRAKDRAQLDSADYTPGVWVEHRSFGLGQILNRQGDIATISFDQTGEKRIALSVALRRHQLWVEKK